MSRNAETRVHVVVSGRVQGVFFRATIAEEAERLGVTGWISNRADGAVEAEFQGPRDDVDELVDACRRGSRQSRVDDVTVEAMEPEPDTRGFKVR